MKLSNGMKLKLPKDLIGRIRESVSKGRDVNGAIEEEAYVWIDSHPKTLWTGLELVQELKSQEAELFSPFLL